MSKLDENTRVRVISYLSENLEGCMFGDGQEMDYILDGMEFKGLNNMSDEELVEMLEGFINDGLLLECKAQLVIQEVLTEKSSIVRAVGESMGYEVKDLRLDEDK